MPLGACALAERPGREARDELLELVKRDIVLGLALGGHRRGYSTVGSLAVTMCVINTLAIVVCVALARRRGGWVLMFAAAFGISLMSQSLPGEAMHDIWNPAAALFPFLALVFVGWSLACGEYRLLPLAAVLASFAVQTHLMYLAPTLVVLGVGLGGARAGGAGRPPP